MPAQAQPLTKPKVSVLMSVYQGHLEWVRAAVESMLQQTFTDFEFLIFDDGTPAEIAAYLDSLADPRLVVKRDGQNKGLAVRLNEGLELAQGQYVARMDADDLSVSTRLAQQVAFMDARSQVAASSGGFRVIGTGQVRRLPISAQGCADWLWFTSPLCHPAVMLRREVLEKQALRYPELPCAQDYGLWLALQRMGFELSNMDEVLLEYRVHESSITQQSAAQKAAVLQQIQQPLLVDLLGRLPTAQEQKAHVGLALGQRQAGWLAQLQWLVRLLWQLPTARARLLALRKTLRVLLRKV